MASDLVAVAAFDHFSNPAATWLISSKTLMLVLVEQAFKQLILLVAFFFGRCHDSSLDFSMDCCSFASVENPFSV